MSLPRRTTFRRYALYLELSALVLTFSILFVAIWFVLSEMNHKYLELRLTEVGKVQLFLERGLEEAKETLDTFGKMPEAERTPTAMKLFHAFSDVYRLDRALHITQIYKATPGSKVFNGFTFTSGKLANYLNSVGKRSEFSEIMRGYEDDQPSIYFVIREESYLYLARLDLTYIQSFLTQFSRFSGSPVLLIAKDGFVMLSGDTDLRIPVFDLKKWTSEPTARRTLMAGNRRWIPVIAEKSAIGAGIVVLIPTELLDTQRNTLMVFLCSFMGILIILVVIKNYKLHLQFIQPIELLAEKMHNLEKGQNLSDDTDVNYRFEELNSIQTRFRSMTDAILQREQTLGVSEEKYRLASCAKSEFLSNTSTM